MITLKLGSYTPYDCDRLHDILFDAATKLCEKQGSNGRCNLCPARKVCSDLTKASSFAELQAHQKRTGK